MRKSHAGIGALVLAAASAALITAGAAHASTHKPAEDDGCGNGVVCMYTDSGWQSKTPEHTYWTYGCANLTNETGDRVVFNNQYGGALATLYTGSDCNGTATNVGARHTWQGDIGPINSIMLSSN